MKDEIYLRGSGPGPNPRRGCGCLVAAAVVAAVAGYAAYALFFKGKPADPGPVPGQSEPGTPAPGGTPETGGSKRPPGPDNGVEWLARAKQALTDQNLTEARSLARRVLRDSSNAQAQREAESLLSELHTRMVFSKIPMPEKVDYTIKSGDTLGEIAKSMGTTVELIKRGNKLKSDRIRIGDRLRIFKGTFFVEVNKTRNELIVFLNDEFFKRYRVGTGEFASTPVGTFKINDRIEKPTWWREDGKSIPYGHKDNLLGTHWLSLNIKGYGIHGTWEPDSIGKQSSAGCVRLVNEEIEELYALLPLGTTVEIIE